MTLSEELAWRGFTNQTTYKDLGAIDGQPITFYLGVDPSSDSMTVGNLAATMMVRHFIEHGHKAILLVGGATGLIGDPDGKSREREQLSPEQVATNKDRIAAQYKQLFAGQDFELVDNYDWFKDILFLDFLRDVGKHVPMRQMLGRDFVQKRLSEDGHGISYAEFSYALIQGYDFLKLSRDKGVALQVCGADQWGNAITGVDLIRRLEGKEAHVWSAPLIVNKQTGAKFGKTEAGAVWLDADKTTPTQFYQFWINQDDDSVGQYLKIFTLLSKDEISNIMAKHIEDPGKRLAQQRLAEEATAIVHGSENAKTAREVTEYLTGQSARIDDSILDLVRREIPSIKSAESGSLIQALVDSGLAVSMSDARRLLSSGAVYINGQKAAKENFDATDFADGRALLRRGKAYRDTALVELG